MHISCIRWVNIVSKYGQLTHTIYVTFGKHPCYVWTQQSQINVSAFWHFCSNTMKIFFILVRNEFEMFGHVGCGQRQRRNLFRNILHCSWRISLWSNNYIRELTTKNNNWEIVFRFIKMIEIMLAMQWLRCPMILLVQIC